VERSGVERSGVEWTGEEWRGAMLSQCPCSAVRLIRSFEVESLETLQFVYCTVGRCKNCSPLLLADNWCISYCFSSSFYSCT
jgi:hypothetical protein